MKLKELIYLMVFTIIVALAVPAHAEWSLNGNATSTQTNVSTPSNLDGLFIVKDTKGIVKSFKLTKTQIIVLPETGVDWTFEGSNADAKFDGNQSTLRVFWGTNGNNTPFYDQKSPARLQLSQADFLARGGTNYLLARAQWIGSHASTSGAYPIGPIAFGGKGKDGQFWGGIEVRIWHMCYDPAKDGPLGRWIELQTAIANGVVSLNSLPDSFVKEDHDYQRASEKDTGKTVVRTMGTMSSKPEDFGLRFKPFPTRNGDSVCMTTTAKVDVILQREWTEGSKFKMKADQLTADSGREVLLNWHQGMTIKLVDPASRQVLTSIDDKGQVIK